MTDPHDHRVLVPIDVLGGEGVPSTVVDALASVPVVLLGYHVVPDQTAPDQARSRFERRVRAELEGFREAFEAAGRDVSTRLVFTHDRFRTFERVAVEADCDAVLLVNPAPVLERVLVAVRGEVNVDHIARLVSTVFADTDLEATLFHVVADGEERAAGDALLEVAAETLASHGVDRDRVRTTVVVGDSPTGAILEAAADHDMIVAGESRPSFRRRILRDRAERIARRTVDPVLVIRGEYLAPGDGSDERR